MRAAENRARARAWIRRRSSRAARRSAAAISRASSTRKPVRPCSTISGAAPRGNAMTGQPASIASIMTSPNGSSQRIGTRSARARGEQRAASPRDPPPDASTTCGSESARWSTLLVPARRAVARVEASRHDDAQPRAARRLDRQLRSLAPGEPAEEERGVAARAADREERRVEPVVHDVVGRRVDERGLALRDRDEADGLRVRVVARQRGVLGVVERVDHGRRRARPRTRAWRARARARRRSRPRRSRAPRSARGGAPRRGREARPPPRRAPGRPRRGSRRSRRR